MKATPPTFKIENSYIVYSVNLRAHFFQECALFYLLPLPVHVGYTANVSSLSFEVYMACSDITPDELQDLTDCIRMLLRDYAPNNMLLDDLQFSDKEIRLAVRLVVSEYNSMPPNSNVTWRFIPEDILFLGAARWLMLSESFLQIRNQVNVPSDGLGVIGIDDKFQFYQSAGEHLKAEYQQKMRATKSAQNIASGYGSLASGYAGVSRFHNN